MDLGESFERWFDQNNAVCFFKLNKIKAITMPNLPEMPVQTLIRLMLADVALCENDPRYQISMDVRKMKIGAHDLHRADPENGTCHVTPAGCIIAKTLKCPIDGYNEAMTDRFLLPETLSAPMYARTRDYLCAAHDLSTGAVGNTVDAFDCWPDFPRNRIKSLHYPVRGYSGDGAAFKEDMQALADFFEQGISAEDIPERENDPNPFNLPYNLTSKEKAALWKGGEYVEYARQKRLL